MMSGEQIDSLESFIKHKILVISPRDFIAICKKAFNDKQPNQRIDEDGLAVPSKIDSKNAERKAWLIDLFNDLRKGNITCFDALTDCLIRVPGENGPHSFKHGLLSQLFGDELNQYVSQDQQVAMQATTAVKSLREIEKKERVAAIINDLKNLTKEQFLAAYENVYQYRKSINAEKSEETEATLVSIFGVLSHAVFVPIYKVGKAIKNKSRQVENDITAQQVTDDRLSVFNAIYDCLTLFIGQVSSSSFKYSFLFSLYGFTYTTADGWHMPVKNDTTTFLRRIYCRGQVNELLDDLVRDMRDEIAAKKAVKIEKIKECLRHFNQLDENVQRERLKQAILSAQQGKARASGFFKAATKNVLRDWEFKGINESLENNQLIAEKALLLCLQTRFGGNGPHSLRYQLLRKLFDWKEDATEIYNTVDCFVEVLSGALPAAKQEANLLASDDEDQSPIEYVDSQLGDDEDQPVSVNAESDDESDTLNSAQEERKNFWAALAK